MPFLVLSVPLWGILSCAGFRRHPLPQRNGDSLESESQANHGETTAGRSPLFPLLSLPLHRAARLRKTPDASDLTHQSQCILTTTEAKPDSVFGPPTIVGGPQTFLLRPAMFKAGIIAKEYDSPGLHASEGYPNRWIG